MKEVLQLLIGKKIKVINSKNKQFEGMEGIVINETKNMVVIETEKGIKKLIKEQIKFKIKK